MLESLLARLVLSMLDDSCALLPQEKRTWGRAIAAELEAIPAPRARVRFGLGGLVGVVRIAARELRRGRLADGKWWVLAASLGLGGSLIDLTADTRWPLWIILGGGSFVLGCWKPGSAWRWGVSISLALPLLVLLAGVQGPYAYDPGDAWYPFLPCVALALLGGGLARKTPGATRSR